MPTANLIAACEAHLHDVARLGWALVAALVPFGIIVVAVMVVADPASMPEWSTIIGALIVGIGRRRR